MKSQKFLLVLITSLLAGFASHAYAFSPVTYADYWTNAHASRLPWHGNYYHLRWSRPVSLVVPPTANMYTQYNWGVSTNEMRPIYHQYGQPYPGDRQIDPSVMRAPSYWPSSTRQNGVYYIRAPW